MKINATLFRSCALLSLSTMSFAQTVSATTLDALQDEMETLRQENAEFRKMLRVEMESKDAALQSLRLELEDIRSRRMLSEMDMGFLDCIDKENSDGDDIFFDGCNVHITSGEPYDNPYYQEINGKGNLIIGYNEDDPRTDSPERDMTGSHNLIIGDVHTYSSYGGLVAGIGNRITSPYSTVSGGERNEASGYASSVSGGRDNQASGISSSVSGGEHNEASGYASSVSGGRDNKASGYDSSISGGKTNTASGDYSSVLGGIKNQAKGKDAVVTGGFNNKAIGYAASVGGGKGNKAGEKFSVVTGA